MIETLNKAMTRASHLLRLALVGALVAGVVVFGLATSAEAAACALGGGSACPGPPTSAVASVTSSPSGSAQVSWAAPSVVGTGIIGYALEAFQGASPVSTSTVGDQLSGTVSGLTNGTSYTFTVAAANSSGYGAASAASNAVTPSTVPSPPTGVSAVAGNASATVSWSAPISDGGAAVSSYVLTASPGGASATVSGTTLNATVDGLTNGTSYTFTVVATNSQGSGTSSNPSSSVTPTSGAVTVPDAPAAPTGAGGASQATLNWSAPANSGGAAITSYVVKAFQGGTLVNTLSVTAPSTSVVVTGLTNGLAYTFDVAAVNSVGPGNASPLSRSVAVAANSQSITFTGPSSDTVGLSMSLSATGGPSGNPVVFSVDVGSTSGACAISGDVVTFTGVGTCVIDANQAGTTNYSSAAQVQLSVAVRAGSNGSGSSTGPTNAPPPAGVTVADLGTPESITTSTTSPTVVTLNSGGASDVITVPQGALPSGTTLSVYPITNTAPLVADVPAGSSYVVALAVSWQAPDGSSPAANVPIKMTITDANIVAGDVIYELTSSGLIEVGVATVDGGVTISFTSDPVFIVAQPNVTTPTAQVALSVTSTSATLGRALRLAASGGSGSGALTFSVTNGTAKGCALSGALLSATSPGTCLVVATKASDSHYSAISSPPTAVAFVLPARPGAVTVGFVASRVALTRAVSRTLGVLAGKLLAGASVTVTSYAKADARVARVRLARVLRYLLRRVKVHVRRRIVTNVSANKITVVTTKQ